MDTINEAFSVTRTRREASFAMPSTHMHDTHEIFYMISGECNMFLNHTIYKLTAGDLVLIPSGYIHKTNYSSKGQSNRYAMRFGDDDLGWVKEQVPEEIRSELMREMVFKIPEKRRTYLENIMSSMYYERQHADEYSATFNRLYLQEIYLFLVRCMKYKDNMNRQITVENDLIQDVASYIYKNYEKNIQLEQLAKQFSISRSYLSKKFKATTGVGFKEYLTSVRIQEACKKLLETDMSITQVALECGFNDSNYFGDAFRHYKGISPNKYRKTKGTM